MKLLNRLVLPSLLFVATSSSFAAAGYTTSPSGSDALSELVNYVLNLGSYLGYDLQSDPTKGGKQAVSQTLLNPNPTSSGVLPVQLLNSIVFNNFLGGSFLVNTAPIIAQIVSDTTGDAYPKYVNALASYSLNPGGIANQLSYSTPSQTGVSVSQLIDQPPYQADPTNQTVLNILGTPDYSYCMDSDEKGLISCPYNQDNTGTAQIMNEYQVMANVIGVPLPGADTYFSYTQTQPLLGQLSVNSLITPLMYSKTALPNPNAGGTTGENAPTGLTAMSQTQQAANFIRYVAGIVSPLSKPDRSVYDNWVAKANGKPSVAQQQAQAVITSYLTSLRVYAAQVSIGISNLYYIMSKRLPQGQDANAQTSQALSEFNMATRRLYNPNQSLPNQWITLINNASAATVQKEIAVLLSEINYQLYLNRQQEERILLTNSLFVLQNAKANQPSAQLNLPITGTQNLMGGG